jgi:hypothetical protein
MKKNIVLIILLIIGVSCHKDAEKHQIDVPDAIIKKTAFLKKSALNQLQQQDTFKIKTAQFFLDNLKYQKNCNGLRHDKYSTIINKYAQNQDSIVSNISRIKDQLPADTWSYDVQTIDKNKLIGNINQTYKTYLRCRWNHKISFDTYCQYLLPYKVNHEPLVSNWRDSLQTRFLKENSDSIFGTNIVLAATKVHQWLRDKKNNFKIGDDNALNMPDLSPEVLDKLMGGSCHEMTAVGVAYMRAMGIPASIDFAPTYLNINSGHEWATVIIDSTHFLPFDITSRQMNEIKKEYYFFSKVYRRTFLPVENSHFIQRGPCSFLPEFFNNPFLKDVTPLYTKTANIKIPIAKDIPSKIKFCYLGVFNRAIKSWELVSWGRIADNEASFKNIGTGGVYIAIIVESNGSAAVNSPFILNKKGAIHFLTPDVSKLETIKINRKYFSNKDKEVYKKRMIGGVFQGASDPEFLHPVHLYTITKNPGGYFNEVPKGLFQPFRYVRYLSPMDSYGNVAEIEFYEFGGTSPLEGTLLGTNGSYQDDPKCWKESAFDGDVLTYVDTKTQDHSWMGLDLGAKKEISKIRYIARNDMNCVQIGNLYELFYWQDAWKSLGKKTATTPFLVYNNVPKNAVLWLRNLTEGSEERIFTYEKGTQVWW